MMKRLDGMWIKLYQYAVIAELQNCRIAESEGRKGKRTGR
jgi:hypothetical protein